MKKLITGALVLGSITAISIDTYHIYKENQLIRRVMQSEYNPKRMIENKITELKNKEAFEANIRKKKEEIVSYIGSEEYRLREETRAWRLPLGITVDQLQPINAKLSFYSSLPEENGIYGLTTASGVEMNSKTVANNFLPFGTMIYMEGYGMKINEDKGSPKYFNSYDKFDVYVQRNNGESNPEYKERVNSYGRVIVKAYIIKEQ